MVNTDASAYIGGAPMTDEFLANLQRQESGMPPAGAVDVSTRFNGEAVTVPVSLARDALYKHMAELRRKLSSADNIPDPYQFAGNGNPYLADMISQHQAMEKMATAEIEHVRAELVRLESLTDTEVVRWAVENGHIAHHTNGGLVLV